MVLDAVAIVAATLSLGLLLPFGRRRVRTGLHRVGRAALALGLAAVGILTVVPGVGTSWARAAATSIGSARAPAAWGPQVEHSGPGYPGIARWRIVGAPPTSDGRTAGGTRSSGEVGSVVITGASSAFSARPAIVYLPPAALTAHPPRLPVVIALSGQSRHAGPPDLVRGGGIARIMDGIAQRHRGVAPIVVVPDQLGAGPRNPMCVDSGLGRVATYLTVDVRRWILTHLPAAADRRDWTVAGFSEGGTCAIQFGAGRPDLFGSLVDVSGEEAPRNGSLKHTVAVGFGADGARYAAATPFRLLARHHYNSTDAWFAAGALDRQYGEVAPLMAARARDAGMTVHVRMLPGLKHNWRTGHAGLAWGLDGLQDTWPAETAATTR